jgi:hypothetical protein
MFRLCLSCRLLVYTMIIYEKTRWCVLNGQRISTILRIYFSAIFDENIDFNLFIYLFIYLFCTERAGAQFD